MNQHDQKLKNRTEVLGVLRSSPGISQVEIAYRTKLQPSTTSNLVRTLRDIGFVTSVGKRASGPQGGKKAEVLALRADYGFFGGIYLKEDEIIFGVVDFGGNIVSRRRAAAGNGQAALLDEIVSEIGDNRRHYPTYFGTGIAVSSVVNSDGEIAESIHFARTLPKIVSEIRALEPGLPVIVDNDANCAADWDLMAAGNGLRNLVHLQVQTSPVTVGAGIVIDGELYRGTLGAAGEILQPTQMDFGASLVDDLAGLARFVAVLLDTQAVFIAGELDGATLAELRSRTLGTGQSVPITILDNPDLPVLGASLQAIRMHINQIMGEC